MTQLIITILVIGLTTAMATAAILYMGPAVTDNRARMEAASILSQMQQISAAWLMYRRMQGVDPVGSTTTHVLDVQHDLITSRYMTDPPIALRGMAGAARFTTNPDPVSPDIALVVGAGLSSEFVTDLCDEINRMVEITTPVTTAPTAADAVSVRAEASITNQGCLLQYNGAAAAILYRL